MDKIFTNNVQQAEWEIKNVMRNYYFRDDYICVMSVAYLLYKASSSIKPNNSYNEILKGLKNEEAMFIRDCFRMHDIEFEEIWGKFQSIALKYVPAVFVQILLKPVSGYEYCGISERPESINKLLEKILDLKNGENVLETHSGLGESLIYLTQRTNCSYKGLEYRSYECEIAKIRTAFLERKVDISQANFMEYAYDEQTEKYNKIFSFHPLGCKISGLAAFHNSNLIEQLNNDFEDNPFKKSTSFDWGIATAVIKKLKNDGKAVLIVTDGSLFSNADEQIRKKFVEKGYIEAIISLPKKLFATIGANVSLLVLSNDNKSIRLVNARHICQEGRRQNTLSEDDIAEIYNLYKNGGKYTIDVGLGEIQPNKYSLSPERYMTLDNIELKNPVEFGRVVNEIGRSAPLAARQLDELVSEEPTNIRYVRLADIQNGIISDELPYLKAIESRHERYLLRDGDLLLSKMGAPFKTAIVKIEGTEKILPVGNMYVIRVNNDKIDVHYLKAFLESSKGIALLNSITSGTTIPIINVDSLQRMPIECPDIVKQEKIANKYQAICDEIALLKLKLAAATERLSNVIDE